MRALKPGLSARRHSLARGHFVAVARAPAGASLLYFCVAMPKMKTHSGAKKRFKLTAKGKVRGRHAMTSHILEKKSAKHKRYLGTPMVVSDHDAPRIKKMLGGGK